MTGQTGFLNLSVYYCQDFCTHNTRLRNRGPDVSKECYVSLPTCSAHFIGHVLHLRGEIVAEQPAQDKEGSVLLWNGEIFSGLQVRRKF